MLARHFRQIGWELIVHAEPVVQPALLARNPHALLVDVDLLGPRWDEWIARHPARAEHLGVVVCAEHSTAVQRARGLLAGADDWITKPCDVEELCARIEAIVRGHRWAALPRGQRSRRAAELTLRPDLYDALAGDRRAGLTRREFDLLERLARECGAPVAREELYREVWGYEMAVGDRSIDTFVRKIRTKLQLISPGWTYVHTHKGRGYSFAPRRG
ncbi:MAG TPA: response regulator transcription factor [Solirubrobacteraceae bacterium]|nr:response regulator transcription factor [Solirubrobacteraceae bacterium]